MNVKTYIAHWFEKVATTYIEACIALVLVGSSLGIDGWKVAAVAAIPAGLTAFINSLPQVPNGLPFYLDLVLRTMRTFLASAGGFLIALPVFTLGFATWKAAVAAAIPAALAVAKGLLASKIGNNTPAMLPTRVDVIPEQSLVAA